MDYGASDTSTTVLGNNQFPISEVYVPNTGLKALGGGPKQTDGSSKDYAPALMYIQDGSDVTQGTSTDAANANTVIGQLKQIKSNTASVTVGSLPALPAGTNVIGHVIVDSAGNVSITSLPSLPAGTNVIGHVIVDSGSISVSGTVTANAGSGTFANQQSNVQSDYDTGAGTQNMTMFGVALPASGGAVSGGTSSNPFRVDPTGTTTQPVSGSVSVSNFPGTQSVSGTVSVNALPAGSNTIGGVELVDSGGTNKASISAGGAVKVDNSAVTQPISGSVSVSNFPGTQPVSGTVTVQQSTASNLKVDLSGTAANATAIKVDGSAVTQPVSGTFWQTTQPVSGTVTANQGGTWTVQPGNTPNSTPWLVQTQAGTSGGSTPSHLISAATNNATSLKASAGLVYGYTFSNTNASARYVKFYNKASAPAPATDNALIVNTVQVPGNATVIAAIPEGMSFTTGIAFAAVANMADTDNTSIGAGDLSIDIRYK